MKIIQLLFVPLVLLLSCSDSNDSISNNNDSISNNIISDPASILNINVFNSQNGPQITRNTVFRVNDVAGKKYARVPAIIIANNGNVLAACEKRCLLQDKGDMDVMLAISQDNGKSYTKRILFENNTKDGRKMNPSFVIDRTGLHGVKGRIYCFVISILDPNKYANQLSKGESNTLYKYSDDNGVTWSSEFELKDKLPKNCIIFGPSPANGIQLNNGTLVIPAFVSLLDNTYRSGILFKSPNGDWDFSFIDTNVMNNECTISSIDGNSVILNARTEANHCRNIYYSDTIKKETKGIEIIWKNHNSSGQFKVAGSCQGSLEAVPGDSIFYLFSNPINSNPRNRICIWSSLDMRSWTPSYLLTNQGSAGYSVVAYYDNKLFAIYESDGAITECEIQDISPLLNYLKKTLYEGDKVGK